MTSNTVQEIEAAIGKLTPEELTELQARLQEVMDEYRRLDPATRSAGALPVWLTLDKYPLFKPEETR